MEINRIKKLIGLATLLSAALTTTTAFAQNAAIQSKKLPLSLLRKMSPHAAHSNASFAKVGQAKKSLISTAATSGIPGIDSVVNWSDQFTAPGFDSNGNAQSVWPYTMVGNPPESGRTANITAPIVPVVLDLLAKDGTVAIFNGKPLSFGPGPDVLQAAVASPIFQPFIYTSGIGQINDQIMRAEFWNRLPHSHGSEDFEDGWHTNLVPKVRTARRIQVPFGDWFFFTDANNNPILAAVDANTFGNLLFPATAPVDNTTPIGAAELAGDITTRDISSFLFNDVVL